jgi:hypothetical protein
MSWILDHLNIVIVGILVIGSFLKSRFDAVNEDEPEAEDYPDVETFEDEQRQSPPPVPYVPPMVEQAPSPEPPPTTRERPAFAASRSVSGAMTASADEAAIILEKQREIEKRLQAIRETRNAKRVASSPLRARTATRKSTPVAIGGVPTSIRARLRNPAELRRAVILREILDSPVGLR